MDFLRISEGLSGISKGFVIDFVRDFEGMIKGCLRDFLWMAKRFLIDF